MSPLDAHGSIVAVLGKEAHAARALEARRAFEARTGAFGAEDAWFEARSRAFWDFAVTRGGLGPLAAGEVGEDARAWLGPLSSAHRGLFVVEDDDDVLVLRDLLSGVELFVDEFDPGTKDALDALRSGRASARAPSAPFDGRVVAGGTPPRSALLPGAIFHPEDAAAPIESVLLAARARGTGAEDVLDALLRMELSLRKLSRVKASYAYRPEALIPPRAPARST
jgi:hypothetical protein